MSSRKIKFGDKEVDKKNSIRLNSSNIWGYLGRFGSKFPNF